MHLPTLSRPETPDATAVTDLVLAGHRQQILCAGEHEHVGLIGVAGNAALGLPADRRNVKPPTVAESALTGRRDVGEHRLRGRTRERPAVAGSGSGSDSDSDSDSDSEALPVTGLAVNFSPSPRTAPPGVGSVTEGSTAPDGSCGPARAGIVTTPPDHAR